MSYLAVDEAGVRQVFTTGQIAKICKVAPRTVNKWCDSKRLKSHRIPGSEHRRVLRKHLIPFLKEHGVPLGELADEEVSKVLIVGADAELKAQLNLLMLPDHYKIEVAHSAFEAGIQAEALEPDCVIFDFAASPDQAAFAVNNMKHHPELSDIVRIALILDGENFDRTKFHDTFRKPFDTALLLERINTLVARKKKLAS